MRISIKGHQYDAGNVIDAPIVLLMELHRLTGMSGQDVLDGLSDLDPNGAGEGGPQLTNRALMATAAIVWLAKRRAGEHVGFEEAVADLALDDIQPVIDTLPAQPAEVVAPDPTLPGSDPGTDLAPVLGEPLAPSSPSPGVTSTPQSPSIAWPSSTSGPV